MNILTTFAVSASNRVLKLINKLRAHEFVRVAGLTFAILTWSRIARFFWFEVVFGGTNNVFIGNSWSTKGFCINCLHAVYHDIGLLSVNAFEEQFCFWHASLIAFEN